MIRTENLRKIYRMGTVEVKALDGVDIHIEKGEFIGIMGPSGSGKSTLLHMLGLLDTPSSGSIIIDKTDVGKLTDYEKTMFRLYKLGYVFQDYALVPELTVMENVALPAMLRADISEKQYKAATVDILSKIGLCDRRGHLQGELSGGPAAAGRHRPGHREQAGHPLRRRAVCQPGHRELPDGPQPLQGDQPGDAADHRDGLPRGVAQRVLRPDRSGSATGRSWTAGSKRSPASGTNRETVPFAGSRAGGSADSPPFYLIL